MVYGYFVQTLSNFHNSTCKCELYLFFLTSCLMSGFHQHSQGDLWEDPGGSVWYQQRGETPYFSFLFLCSLYISCPLTQSLFLYFSCGSTAVCMVFLKRQEKTPDSFDFSQMNLPVFQFCLLYFPVVLSPSSHYSELYVALSLWASCQLINSSHPTRSQSYRKKTNTQLGSKFAIQ